MRTIQNLEGKKFNMILVVKELSPILIKSAYRIRNVRVFECTCDCGKTKIIRLSNIKRIASCGCLGIKNLVKKRTTHGLSFDYKLGKKSRLYGIWEKIKHRCYTPNCKSFMHYGGRGITICDEWKNNFKLFHDWSMSNGYNSSLSIDRIDVNGNYEPLNCRWATPKTQSNNRTNNVFITYKGLTLTKAQWSEKLGFGYHVIKNRLKRGWSIKESITTPLFAQGTSRNSTPMFGKKIDTK